MASRSGGLIDAVLDILRDEAVQVGSDLIRDGAELVKSRLHGKATDQQVMQWLRDAQDVRVQE